MRRVGLWWKSSDDDLFSSRGIDMGSESERVDERYCRVRLGRV